ncbi:MAG: response regulator transcription factor [Proteobacteria bacterium]|nr:response regulator transcription factor [Pseudomonadota bacterium]
MRPIRVLIADDHIMVQEGLKSILDNAPDIEVVGQAKDGQEAILSAKKTRPDVLLIDIAMPLLTGIDAIQIIREALPETRIVVVTMFHKEPYIRQAFEYGALGYVLKTSPASELINAVRHVFKGEYYLSPQIKDTVIHSYIRNPQKPRQVPSNYDRLSDREKQVFRMIAKGQSTKTIADILNISPKTVAKHRANIMEKLNVKDLISLIKYALNNGIIEPDEFKL